MSSDHLAPWSAAQGASGNSWCFLASAMQATSLPMGLVAAPGPRNHPLVLAQQIATLEDMYPRRLWIALGTGEAANEYMLGRPWPPKSERTALLAEAVEVIRALLEGQEIDHARHFDLRSAKLWTVPAVLPPIMGAALSAETARWAASWADGLITVASDSEQMRTIIDAYRDAGGEGPLYLQVHLSWDPDERVAREGAWDQWRTNVLEAAELEETPTLALLAAAAASVPDSTLARRIRISSDLNRHADWLASDLEMGFEKVFLHNVNREQEPFLHAFSSEVLPLFLPGDA